MIANPATVAWSRLFEGLGARRLYQQIVPSFDRSINFVYLTSSASTFKVFQNNLFEAKFDEELHNYFKMNGTKIVSFKHRRSQVAIDWLTLVSPSKNSLALQTLFFFTTLPSSSLLHFLSLSLSHSQVHSLRTQYFLLSPSLHAFHRRAFIVCQMSITRSHHLLSLSPSLPIYIIATPLYYSPISLSLSWIKLSLLLYLYHHKPYQTLYLFLSFTNPSLTLFH